jgi:1-phosphofructokinase
MIYTVTFNPSLDYIVTVDDFTTGVVNRTSSEKILPGGKGINVSIVLSNLGFANTALGFIGGFTGKEIERELKTAGCHTDFIEISSGISRINLKMKSQKETEINGQGPKINEEQIKQLIDKLDTIQDEDILVLAGSIPGTMPADVYENIMARLVNKNIKVIVDATGDLLVNVLKYHPFLIKPNVHELGEIFHVQLETKDEIIKYALMLQKQGAKNVLISMAGDGAILVSEDGMVYQSNAPKGVVINSVGAGDSMVAGFTAGYLDHENYKEAFKMGIATGSASAFSANLATKEEVLEILKTLVL